MRLMTRTSGNSGQLSLRIRCRPAEDPGRTGVRDTRDARRSRPCRRQRPHCPGQKRRTGVVDRDNAGWVAKSLKAVICCCGADAPEATRRFPERATVDQLGYEVLASVKLTDVVDCQDVRVVQRGGHLRFALEAAAAGDVTQFVRQELDGDGRIQLGIEGTIDLAHAAGADARLHFIGVNPLASQYAWADVAESHAGRAGL